MFTWEYLAVPVVGNVYFRQQERLCDGEGCELEGCTGTKENPVKHFISVPASLNDLGAQGWELVSLLPLTKAVTTTENGAVGYFKRRAEKNISRVAPPPPRIARLR